MKIVQINGFRGILMAGFVVSCLFAGFVLFPGYIAMHFWNKYLPALAGFPVINLFQGVLLWGMCAVSYYILAKGRMPLSFEAPDKLSDAELNMIMKQARINANMRKMNYMMKHSDTFSKHDKIEKNSVMSSPMDEKKEDDNIPVNNLK